MGVDFAPHAWRLDRMMPNIVMMKLSIIFSWSCLQIGTRGKALVTQQQSFGHCDYQFLQVINCIVSLYYE